MARSDRSRRGRIGRIGLACAVGALPLVVACNSIIGLTDFDKGECPGARCGDGGAFPDVFIDNAVPDVIRADSTPPKGADPVSWAKWPIPHYGEGGVGLPPPYLPLEDAGDGVRDPTTRLEWRNTLIAGDFKATDADAECKKLPNGPWRAPKRIELLTLLSFERAKPFIDTTKFLGFFSFKVWTTSEVRPLSTDPTTQPYWVVNFDTGAVEPLAGDQPAKVLCVRDK